MDPLKIDSKQLKRLTPAELKELCGLLRERILSVTSKNGGHLASNLGIVETTVAIHRVFELPEDQVIFDVGHQCYAHKLLTGRWEAFDTLRQENGVSGFPNRFESPYDPLCEGHSGTSISSALGLAQAKARLGSRSYTVAVAGDGSFTNGMIYEALNNCSDRKLRLVIVLNDNGMSISRSVGFLPRYFSRIRSSRSYLRIKNNTRSALTRIPLIGGALASFARGFKNFWKRILLEPVLFDDFGVTYLGPVDGNDIQAVETILQEAKRREEICIVHVLTRKGQGYAPAEQDPTAFHSPGAFDPDSGAASAAGESFSSVFGGELCRLGEADPRIAAVTAAMRDGTGLVPFAEAFPHRFFDVGIAEEHAVTFCGGLAAGGMKPVFAVYSTFLQRCCDQLIHDVSLQRLSLVLAVDRAGFVAGDGITHQGLFDTALLSAIPGVTIRSPESYADLKRALRDALSGEGIQAVRYPRGHEQQYDRSLLLEQGDTAILDTPGARTLLITYGRLTCNAVKALQLLPQGGVSILQLKTIWPLPLAAIKAALEGKRRLLFLEESMRSGGIGEKLGAALMADGGYGSLRYEILAVEDYQPHASVEQLDLRCGFDPESLVRRLREDR